MNCKDAQYAVLESSRNEELEQHIAECEACRRFASTQRLLDERLSAALPAPLLSAGFRAALREKIREQPSPDAWPDYLPDLAHLIGCFVAIGLLVTFFPQHASTVLAAGLGFTIVTYFLQAQLRSSYQ